MRCLRRLWRRVFDRRHSNVPVAHDRRKKSLSGELDRLAETTRFLVEEAANRTDSALDELSR